MFVKRRSFLVLFRTCGNTSMFFLLAAVSHAAANSTQQIPQPGFYVIAPGIQGNVTIAGASDDGTLVAGTINGFQRQMFLWDPVDGTRIIDLPEVHRLGGVSAISGDGSTVGIQLAEGFPAPREAFLWSEAGGFERLGTLSSDRSDHSHVNDLNFDGSVAVGYSDTPEGGRGFRWTIETGLQNLGTRGRTNQFYDPRSSAKAVSDDGSAIVGATTVVGESNSQVGRWTESTGWQVLGSLPESPRSAGGYAMSTDGTVIVGRNQGFGFDGIIWDEENGLRALPRLTGGDFEFNGAYKVSGNGDLIGGMVVDNIGGFRGRGIVWEKHDNSYQPQLLDDFLVDRGFDLEGGETWDVSSISADGRIISGRMRDALGNPVGYMAVLPVPEPVSVSLVAIVFVLGVFSRRNLNPYDQ